MSEPEQQQQQQPQAQPRKPLSAAQVHEILDRIWQENPGRWRAAVSTVLVEMFAMHESLARHVAKLTKGTFHLAEEFRKLRGDAVSSASSTSEDVAGASEEAPPHPPAAAHSGPSVSSTDSDDDRRAKIEAFMDQAIATEDAEKARGGGSAQASGSGRSGPPRRKSNGQPSTTSPTEPSSPPAPPVVEG